MKMTKPLERTLLPVDVAFEYYRIYTMITMTIAMQRIWQKLVDTPYYSSAGYYFILFFLMKSDRFISFPMI